MAFDATNVKTTDWGVIGCAVALLLFSLVSSFVTLNVEDAPDGFGFSGGVTAWDSYGALGVLLLVAVGALAAVQVFGGVALPALAVGWNVIAAAAAALGTLLLVLRAFTYGGGDFAGVNVDVGPGWSGWLVMLLAVGETVFAVLAFRESGEAVPWQQSQRPATGQPPPPPSV